MKNRAAVVLLFGLGTLPAHAATCGGILNPILVVATPMVFGLYQPGSASATPANGTVTVSCTVTLGASLPGFTIALSPSTTGDIAPRKMSFGTARLGYDIYTTNGYGTVWGDGTGGSQTQTYSAGRGLGTVPYTAYGSIPAHEFATPGAYLDGITVTVTY
jgi:spore coat protein U-like protein